MVPTQALFQAMQTRAVTVKLRHIRPAAVSGFAILALTGAGGIGCSGDPGGQASSGSSASPTTESANSADDARDPKKDVDISDCAYTDKRGITATLSATDTSATVTYTYNVTVKFTAPDGTPVATQEPSLPYVRPGRMDTLDIAAPYTPKAGASTKGVKCEITQVKRTTG